MEVKSFFKNDVLVPVCQGETHSNYVGFNRDGA